MHSSCHTVGYTILCYSMITNKSSSAFCRWRKRMGLTYEEAALRLDLCRAAISNYNSGMRRNKKEDELAPVEVPKHILLACAAIEAGLTPVE